MRSLSFRLLLSFLALICVPVALAHDVTLTGTTSFAALDGSASDHDGSANGVFTVNDGNLIVNGVVNCNDDGASSNACPMSFNVSGNMSVNTGGALYAENRTGSGIGGAITLTVGGNVALSGNAIVSSASKSSSGSTGGAITANVGGSVSLASGTTFDSGSATAAGGAILIAAGGTVSVNGNVFSGPSRTLLATRLSGGAALDGGTSNTIGGAITISSSTFAEPSVVIGSTANIVSQGADGGAGPVTIDGCGIQVYGLIAALSKKDGAAKVTIRSGKDVVVDGRDLGGSGTRMGRIRADAPTGTAINKGVDIFGVETVNVYGPSGSLFTLTSLPGLHDSKSYGGLIRIISLADAVNASGNVIDDGHTASGDSGGTVEISAKEDVNLDTAVIRAYGDFNTNNNNRGGGSIDVRSYSGDVIWTNGTGDVRPVGSSSNLPLADQGAIVLTACGTVNTTGSTFPVMGTATSMFPETHTGVCSPAAPVLPVGVPPLITCNTPPVADDASATTNEDTTVTITLSGSDADGDPLTFSIVSGPSNGVLGPIVPTGPTSATVNYTPNLNYNGGDSFVYEANDGNGGTDTATVSITITPVNDPPTFLAGPTVTVNEDSGPQTYPNWVTAITPGPADESGQTVTFTVTNNNNALFSVQPAVDAAGTLTFTPAANANGSATITITAQDSGGIANGGDDTSNPQTSSIVVTAVNDEPSFTAGGNVSVNEDSGAYSAAWASAISAGPADESGQTLTFNVTNDNNALFAAQPAISSSGVLTFTPAADATGTATVTVSLSDNGGIANGGDDTSPSVTFTISVSGVNDPPSFTSGGDVTVLEDSGAYSAAWATAISAGPADESGQTVTFNITGNSDPSLFASGPAISATGDLSFTLNANLFGSSTITVTLSDNGGGTDTSAPQSFTITVDPVNDEPSFVSGGDVTASEDSGAYSAAWATSISAGPANESGQTLTFHTSNDNNALFSVQPAVSSSGVLTFTPAADANGSATVTIYLMDDGGIADGGDDTSAAQTFTITVSAVNDPPSFTSGGDVSVLEDSAAYSAAWATGISAGPADEAGQTFTFNITGNSDPSLFASGPSISATGVLSFTLNANAFGSSTITVTLSDNGGGSDTSAPQSFTITVGPVNDEPSFVAGGNVTVNEDSGAYSAAWATAISAGPNESGQTLTFNVSNDNNALFSAQPSISSTGVLSFTPAPNASGSAAVTVYLMDSGGIANGGDDTSPSVTFTITVIDVNEPPVAGNDSWETEGNTELRVDLGAGLTPHVADTTPSTRGVLNNDVDGDADPLTVTGVVGCGDVVAPYDCAITGGTVSLNANGSFSFQPSPGATSGSFQYTVFDGTNSATGTVSITIHDMIWYVNGSVPPGGNGTSSSPFSDFSSLNGLGDVDGAGDYIFVHTSAVSGSIILEASQKLWGQGIGLIIPRNLNGNGFPTTLVAPGVRPTVTAIAGDTVLIGSVTGVEVAGMNIVSASGNGIDVTSSAAAAGASIYSNGVTASAGEGIDINANSAAGTSVAINTTDVVAMGDGINLLANDGNVVFSYSNGSVTSMTGSGIVVNGSAADSLVINGMANVTIGAATAVNGISINTARFDANPGTAAFDTVSGGTWTVGTSGSPVGGAAVAMTNVSGDLALGSLSAYGTTSGVTIGGTGLFTGVAGMQVTSGGGTVSATAGTGLSVTNTSIGAANLSFTRVSSTGGVNGILLNNTGTVGGLKVLGTGSAASGGTILNTSSHGVSLTSTSSPSFNNLSILNTSGSGVKGTAVVGFAYTNGAIGNSGTGLGTDDSNIAFNTVSSGSENNLAGVVTISGNALTNAYFHGVDIFNFSGTLTDVSISGNTITSTTSTTTSKGSGIRLIAFGSAAGAASVTKATLSNNVITNFPSGAGIVAQGGNANSAGPASTFGLAGNAANVVAIAGNQIAGTAVSRMGTNAIVTSVNGKGQGNFDISNNGTAGNPLTYIAGNVIVNSALGQTTVTSRIANNVIVANHTVAFGGPLGISVGAAQTFAITDAPNYTVEISGNSVSDTDGNGILAAARSSNAVMKARVLNNSVGAPLSGFRQGIRVDSGTSTGNTNVCLEISGNTSAGAGGALGIGLRKQGTNSAVNVFGVVGMAVTSSPGVETYVDSLNPSGGGTQLISAASGFSNCTIP